MATNDNDLDDFFKKKDRKINKHKKPTGLLTNNEELLKQLVIVTSATSAFKENMDFDEEEDEETVTNNHTRHQGVDESNGIKHEENHTAINKSQPNSTAINNKNKPTAKLSVQDNNLTSEQQPGGNQQDEWEEVVDSKAKYDQLRLKFSRATNDQNTWDPNEVNDEYFDDENNHHTNNDDNRNHDDEEQALRNIRRREQLKDKPVWKIDQVKPTESIPTDEAVQKIEDPTPAPKPATSSTAYRPPQLRGSAAVTVVSGVTQRPSKKEKPNLASTEDFPTLGAAINKK